MKNSVIKRIPLVISFLFLFNPNVAIVDPLPDFIGYILLCVALSKLSPLNGNISDALTLFRRMIFIDVGKWLGIFWVFGLSLPTEMNTSLLLFSFIFTALEMIFLIPTYSKLFDGMTQIGYLYPNESILKSGRKRSRTDLMKILTVIFVVIKSVFYTLPEFSYLANSSYDENFSGSINLYRYIGIMRAMSFFLVIVVGVLWVIAIERYFNDIVKDTKLVDALSEKYEGNTLNNAGSFVKRDFKTFVLVAILAAVLSIDVRFDYINFTPDIISALLFIVGFIIIRKSAGLKIKNWIFSSVGYSCAALASTVLEYIFFKRYYYGAIIRSIEARNFYTWLIVIDMIKAVLFLVLLYELYKALSNAIEHHTGYVVGRERMGEGEERMIVSLQNGLKRELVYVGIVALIYVASDICFDIFAPKVDFIGLINYACAALFIGFVIKAMFAIQNAIDTKYMLE